MKMLKNISLFCISLLIGSNTIFAQTGGNLQYVEPTIGGVGLLLEPTRPITHLPNSMVRVYPARKDHLDDQIDYFPLSVYSHRIGNVFSVMPINGESSNVLPSTYDLEQSKPHYYSVVLEQPQVKVEYSAMHRSGHFRFTSLGKGIAIHTGIINEGELNQVNNKTWTGIEEFKGMKAYVYAQFDSPVSTATRDSQSIVFTSSSDVLEMRYGISFISTEQAKQNLEREIPIWGFEKTTSKAEQIWQSTLSQIKVEGGSEAQKRVFYTALYRTYERMVDINEYGRYYSGYDHKVHKDDRPFYVDNWVWDSYVAHGPLHMILNPEKEADKIESYVKMYEQSGWLPSFALVFGDNPCMTGNHAAAWMCDAWFKGIRNFDLKKGYEGAKKNSVQATLLPWKNGPKTVLDDFYAEHHYFPALRKGEKESVPEVDSFEKRQSVAVTLQQSYDDWCISMLANELGLSDDKEFFNTRADYYKNVFRADKGFVWPKDSEGNWIEPFDPVISGGLGGREYFTENNAYIYNWDVKHDLYNLFELMGGTQSAEQKLDQLFRQSPERSKYNFFATYPDATGLVGQFVMGNEPALHIPYLYNYMGSPWKSQKRVRSLIDTWFMDNIFGIPGDDDGGGLSAFAVFSMMGFYQVCPGVPVYTIGSPVFNEIKIELSQGRTFTVKAIGNSTTAKYIQSAKLNNKTLNKAWFTHSDLMQGGVLELIMGETPNTQWGSEELPPLR